MADEVPLVLRRIVVAIDASAASLEALAAAVGLAVRLGSELKGVFVEDEDLLRLAALPFADIFRMPGGDRERIDLASAEAALRALASRAREALERSAARQGVPWSFQVSRGRVARELLAAAEGADLVVLGAASHGRRAPGAVGATARAAAASASTPVLLLARGARLGGEVVAVDDGTPSGERAVAMARALAREDRPPALVATSDGGALALADAIARLGAALAVLPAAGRAAQGALVERLLANQIAVLLVR